MFTRYVYYHFTRARLHKYVGGECMTVLVLNKAEIWLYTRGGSIRSGSLQTREAL